jgi:hypothetical protein
VGFSGWRGERGGHFREVGADVGCGGACVAVVGVSSVGACDSVSEIPLDPCQRRAPEPMGTHLLRGNPRQVLTEADPQVIVAARSDGASVAVAQELAIWRGVTVLGVLL